VNAGTVDDVVGVAIAGDAFMDEFMVFIHHLMPHVYEFMVLSLILLQR
jgi:hypothetical protein